MPPKPTPLAELVGRVDGFPLVKMYPEADPIQLVIEALVVNDELVIIHHSARQLQVVGSTGPPLGYLGEKGITTG